MKIDIHQHVWTPPLVDALAQRDELPFVRREQGLTVLFGAGERPYVIDTRGEDRETRAALVQADGLDAALVCLSSPIGIESLPREEAQPLLEAYLDGALALASPFGVWGAIALDRPDPADAERALRRGCVGLSLPAGAIGSVDGLAAHRAVLATLEEAGAPLLVHPGPGLDEGFRARVTRGEPSLADPLWWPALTRYVADVQAAWLAFVTAGRAEHPRLRIIFTMLAGLAPLHVERLHARGGPATSCRDALTFYETSSYGSGAVRQLAELVGEEQLLYGSDCPVLDPRLHGTTAQLDWAELADGTARAFGERLDQLAPPGVRRRPTTSTPTPAPPRAAPAAGERAAVRARARRRTAAVLTSAVRELSR